MAGLLVWVRSVLLVSFIATLIKVILPDNTLRPFVRLVMGFVLLAVLLRPLVSLVEDPRSYSLFDMQLAQPTATSAERWIELGKQLETRGMQVAVSHMTGRLQQQIEAMIALLDEVEDARVDDLVLGDAGVQRVFIRLRGFQERGDSRVKEMLVKYFGIPEAAVVTYWITQEGA